MSANLLVQAVVTGAATAAAVIDLRTRRVPNVLTMSVALAGVALSAAGAGRVGAAASMTGCLVGLGVMLPGYVFGALGGGDVKLMAAFGALLGPAATIRAFVATTIAGGVIALVVAAHRGRLRSTLGATGLLVATAGSAIDDIRDIERHNRFAYAPAIAIGAIVAALT